MPQQVGVPVTLQLAGWVVRDWMNRQVAAAANRLPPVFQGSASYHWRNNRNPEALAAEIRRDIRWLLVQGSWQLSSPTDQEVLALASELIGGVRGDEVQLLADAIIIAGAPKNSPQRRRAEERAAMTLGGLAIRGLLDSM